MRVRNIALLLLVLLAGCGKREGGGVADEPAGGIEIQKLRDLAPGEVIREALAPREAVEGTLFQRVPSAESGLDFVHRWEPRDEYERDQIGNAFAGGGVALGDVDNDGLPDVFLTRPHGGARLYRNLGGFRFADVSEEFGIEAALRDHWASGATFVDIQGDGYLDIYVCGFRSANKLLVNTGSGRFEERAHEFGLDFAGASVMMSFADYDRDGDLDAYLLTNRLSGERRPANVELQVVGGRVIVPEPHRDDIGAIVKADGSLVQVDAGQRDRLYRNDGGKFVDSGESAGIAGHWHGLSATWWDYNSDGWVDLYVANDFFGPDHLYRNNKDGTFTDVIAETVPHTPWFSMGADAGDLNGDGMLDFIAADMAATTHYKQKVNMGDMDQDGWFLETGTPRQYMRNAVYINTGTSRFLEVAHLTGMANTDWTWAVKIHDFDNDGRNDVFFSNGMTRDFFHADLRAELRRIKETTGENRWGDYPPLKERNRLFRNGGGFAFDDVSESWGITDETVSFGAAAGDLDGDGDLDLVVNNFEEPAALLRNTSAGAGVVKVALRGRGDNGRAIGAELRAKTELGELVRVLQPVRGFMGCDPAEVVFGLGSAQEISELTIRWPSGAQHRVGALAVGSRYLIAEPADGQPAEEETEAEALFVGLLTPARHSEQPFDDFALQPLLPNQLSRLGPAMAWGDIDGNGYIDLFLGGAAGSAAQLWIQTAGGNLVQVPVPQFAAEAQHEDIDAAFFDANGDDKLDLYVVSGGVEGSANGDAYRDRLYLNTGRGIVKAPVGSLPDTRFSGGAVAAGDCDGDGDLDLFVGARVVPGQYPRSSPSKLLLNDGAGRFSDATGELAPELADAGMVTDALWSDSDSDGDLDLLVTTEYGPVRVFQNESGTLHEATAAAGLASLLGWWNCVAEGDFDGDGDPDYAVGNFGLNTKYHPTPAHPQLLFYGAFGSGGAANIVEAHAGSDGELLPNRGRSCSSGAMPFIAEKFGNFHEFAVADLASIYSEPKLERSLRLEANQLASGILLNDGKGRFGFRPLPLLAQVAPCFGLAVLDADGDNDLDLYVSQNYYSPQRETGRMAGGLGALLLGKGDGEFTALWPEESGIAVADDTRAASAIDLNADGRPDLAVAVNNGAVRIFLKSRRP